MPLHAARSSARDKVGCLAKKGDFFVFILVAARDFKHMVTNIHNYIYTYIYDQKAKRTLATMVVTFAMTQAPVAIAIGSLRDEQLATTQESATGSRIQAKSVRMTLTTAASWEKANRPPQTCAEEGLRGRKSSLGESNPSKANKFASLKIEARAIQ